MYRLAFLLFLWVYVACKTSEPYARQAQEAYIEGRYLDAISLYKKINKVETNKRYAYNLALSYGSVKLYDEAIGLLSTLSRQLPKNFLVKRSLAYYYVQNGQDEMALAVYNDLLAFNVMDKEALMAKALILHRQGHSQQALIDLANYYAYITDPDIKNLMLKIEGQ